jgi:hypothetical protein
VTLLIAVVGRNLRLLRGGVGGAADGDELALVVGVVDVDNADKPAGAAQGQEPAAPNISVGVLILASLVRSSTVS